MLPKKTAVIVGGAVAFVVILLGLLFTCAIPGLQSCTTANKRTNVTGTLSIWGVGDTPDAYKAAIDNFKKQYSGVNITYRAFDNAADYQRALLDALAANQGPDIFEIRNNDVPQQYNKIVPLPPAVLPLVQVRTLFPTTVEADFAPQGTVYALPLSIDTLALIYNRRLLDQAAVAVPQTWEDVQSAIPRLAAINPSTKAITQAAIALGGSNTNIDHATDILSLLMLQSGAKMVSSDFKSAMFASSEGVNALAFYTQFANAANPSYTWSAAMPNSIDSFSAEKTAMIVDYASAIPRIKTKNAFMTLGIAPVPQPKAGVGRPIAYASYWGYAVSRQSKNQTLAWQFIVSMTTNTTVAEAYLKLAGKPPALVSLIKGDYLNDPDFSVFARQALVARAWPEINPAAIQTIFSQMIDAVNANQATPSNALSTAESGVTQLMGQNNF